MLFSSPLHSLEFRALEDFCRTWPEGGRVGYKRELVARHFPKVVSSFANTGGGVWFIGVATAVDNCPAFPIRGFPREPGLEERITQACYQNLYPPLLPEIKIIDFPGDLGNVIAVVQCGPSSVGAICCFSANTVLLLLLTCWFRSIVPVDWAHDASASFLL